jgi:hypothetical protein
VKVGVVAALAGISYDFGMSTVTRTRIRSLESYGRYFPKEGFGDHHARVTRTRRKKRASEKWRRPRWSSCPETQTSTQELTLAKPLKSSKKFVAQPSGLSIAENASPASIKISRKKVSSTSAGGSDAALALAHALDLNDSGSSASDGEAALLAPPRKRPKRSPAPKNAPKSSVAKGNFKYFLSLLLL